MARRILTLLIIIAMGALMVAGLPGCGDGEETTSTTEQIDQPSSTQGEDDEDDQGDANGDVDDRFDELADLEATVEVIIDDETNVIWSQKDGNWRWQDPQDPESYVIYNVDEGKLWVVNDKVAQESEEAGDDSMYWGMSPAGLLGLYTMLPGTMTDDTYEISVQGAGRVVIELKGPEGLPSKFTVYGAGGDEEESIAFKYTDVGNVSDDLFVLPSDVSVEQMPDLPDIPTDGSIPEIP